MSGMDDQPEICSSIPSMRIYFLGICGTAMGNAALLAKGMGHSVSGADTGIYPPMSDVLQKAGIAIDDGYSPQLVNAARPDLIVVGNALSRGNPVIEWLLDEHPLPFTSLPSLLASEVIGRRPCLVVSGTHGKTTTTTLATLLLRDAGDNPGWLIGGVPQDLPCGATVGGIDRPFVIEGDEYDSAFFDKRSKFIHYRPRVLTINNLEFDHADIFRDVPDIQRTFRHVIRLVPSKGFLVTNGDDPLVEELLPAPWTTVYRVGTGANCDLRIADFCEDTKGSSFTLLWHDHEWGRIQWHCGGIFNARNAATAALAAAIIRNPANPTELDLGVLQTFAGVKRRQEVRASRPGLTIIEDFGHHPTAIAHTLISLRNRYPRHRIVACVEPRSNTARTRVLQQQLIDALHHTDAAFVGPIDRPEKLARDSALQLDTVCNALVADGIAAMPVNAFDELEQTLQSEYVAPAQPASPTLICFFTNGSFGGIIQRVADSARTEQPTP